MIERFGLFVEMMFPEKCGQFQRGVSFWVGLSFILVSAIASIISSLQYRNVLKTLNPDEIPPKYNTTPGLLLNLFVALMGIFLSVYLLRSMS